MSVAFKLYQAAYSVSLFPTTTYVGILRVLLSGNHLLVLSGDEV